MARLYLMRHGQTLFNQLHRIQGACDSPLTELGCEQARIAGAWLRDRGVTFDHAYASTAERACDTLELAFPGLAYERVKGLKERNFGKFEGISETMNPPRPYNDFFVPFGGEGEQEYTDRVMSTIEGLMARPGHESVLMVSHAGTCFRFPLTLGLVTRADAKRFGNCAIAVIDCIDGTYTLEGIYNPADEALA